MKIDRIEASGDLSIVAAQGDEPPAFTMQPAYSGGELHVANYRYPVVANVAGVSWDRLPKIRRNHENNARVGHATSVTIENNEIHVDGLVSATGQVAQEVLADARNGYPWQSSVTLIPQVQAKYIKPGQTIEANGRTFSGPLYYVERSLLTEVSFVDVGGDREANANIAASEGIMSDFGKWLEAEFGLDESTLDDGQREKLEAKYNASLEADKLAADDSVEAIKNMRKQMRADQAAAVREGERIQQICAKYNNPTVNGESLAAKALEEDWTAEKTELEAMKAYRAGNAPAIHVSPSALDNETVAASMLLSAEPTDGGLTDEQAVTAFGEKAVEAANSKPMRNMSLRRLGGLVLQAAGRSYTPGQYDSGFWNEVLAADRAITASSGLSSMSMAGTLSNVANKSIEAAFIAVLDTLSTISSRSTANDFKEHTQYRMVGIGKPEKVGSDGELKHMELDEATYSNQVETYGRMLGLSRTMLINDDLGQFTRLGQHFGRKAAVQVQRVGFTEWLSGIGTFWSVGNNNQVSGALDIASLTAAEQALMEQVDEDGDPIVTSGRYLLVPPALATTAQNIYSSNNLIGQGADAGPTTENNPHVNKYQPVVSQFLSSAVGLSGASDTAWWLVASPADISTIDLMFLNGRAAPTVEQAEASFNTLGMQWRVYLDFGVSLHEYRGSVYSPGT